MGFGAAPQQAEKALVPQQRFECFFVFVGTHALLASYACVYIQALLAPLLIGYIQKTKPPISAAAGMSGFVLVGMPHKRRNTAAMRSKESLLH